MLYRCYVCINAYLCRQQIKGKVVEQLQQYYIMAYGVDIFITVLQNIVQ